MIIVREARHENKFVQLDNRVVRDGRVSFKARGLLAYLLSFPDNWRIDSEEIAEDGKDGRDAIRSALKELGSVGYFSSEKQQNDKGQWITVSIIREIPTSGFPSTEDGFSDVGEPVAIERRSKEDVNTSDASTQGVHAEPPEVLADERSNEEIARDITLHVWAPAARGKSAQDSNFIKALILSSLNNGVSEERLKIGVRNIVASGQPVLAGSLTAELSGESKKPTKKGGLKADVKREAADYVDTDMFPMQESIDWDGGTWPENRA